jgi:hypothetical protein
LDARPFAFSVMRESHLNADAFGITGDTSALFRNKGDGANVIG